MEFGLKLATDHQKPPHFDVDMWVWGPCYWETEVDIREAHSPDKESRP